MRVGTALRYHPISAFAGYDTPSLRAIDTIPSSRALIAAGSPTILRDDFCCSKVANCSLLTGLCFAPVLPIRFLPVFRFGFPVFRFGFPVFRFGIGPLLERQVCNRAGSLNGTLEVVESSPLDVALRLEQRKVAPFVRLADAKPGRQFGNVREVGVVKVGMDGEQVAGAALMVAISAWTSLRARQRATEPCGSASLERGRIVRPSATGALPAPFVCRPDRAGALSTAGFAAAPTASRGAASADF